MDFIESTNISGGSAMYALDSVLNISNGITIKLTENQKATTAKNMTVSAKWL